MCSKLYTSGCLIETSTSLFLELTRHYTLNHNYFSVMDVLHLILVIPFLLPWQIYLRFQLSSWHKWKISQWYQLVLGKVFSAYPFLWPLNIQVHDAVDHIANIQPASDTQSSYSNKDHTQHEIRFLHKFIASGKFLKLALRTLRLIIKLA